MPVLNGTSVHTKTADSAAAGELGLGALSTERPPDAADLSKKTSYKNLQSRQEAHKPVPDDNYAVRLRVGDTSFDGGLRQNSRKTLLSDASISGRAFELKDRSNKNGTLFNGTGGAPTRQTHEKTFKSI